MSATIKNMTPNLVGETRSLIKSCISIDAHLLPANSERLPVATEQLTVVPAKTKIWKCGTWRVIKEARRMLLGIL